MRVSMLGQLPFNKGVNKFDHLALLMTRQAADFFKNLPDFASWSALMVGSSFHTQQMFNRNIENFCQAANLIWA